MGENGKRYMRRGENRREERRGMAGVGRKEKKEENGGETREIRS